MTLRKKFAKALRSKIGSALLIGTMAGAPIGGGLYTVDQILDDHDASTNAASQAFRTEMIAETNDILDKRKRMSLLYQGAEQAETADAKMDFMDKHDAYRDALLARAEEVAVKTLTNKNLTEEDYDAIETRFDRVESRFDYTGDDLKLNMPGLHRRLDECQIDTEEHKDSKEQAFAVRDCMMEDRNQVEKVLGTVALTGGSLMAIFGLAGGTQAPQRLAKRLETPSTRRRRRTLPPAN